MASDGIFISNRPQLAIARETTTFASLGLNDPALVRIIYKIGTPFISYIPSEEFNAIQGIENKASYLLYVNSFYDGSPSLANAALSNLIPQTSTNVFAGERTVFYCTTAVTFAAAGITTSNTTLITLCSDGYFTSYDPNEAENGIDGFVVGELYYIDPILDIDLHLYGVTEFRYSDEVLYLDSLEDVVVTNSNPDATLPLAEEEVLVRNITTGVWENKPVSDLPTGTSYTDEQAQDATAAMIAAGTHTGITFTYDDAGNKISAAVTGSGVNALAAIGSTPNANAATISGSTLNLQPANSSFGGVVTTLAQTFAGVKTFQGSASSGSRQLSGITSGTGNGVFGQSQNGGYGGEFNTLHSSTNTMRAAVKVVRETSGTAAVGIGSAVSYHAESSDNNVYGLGMSGRVIYGLLGTSIQSAIRHTVYDKSVEIIADETFAATVTTSDATPTNLITIPVTDETAAVVEVTIVGKEVSTNGIVTGKKIFRYKKDGGTLSLGTQTSVLADEATGTIATATYAISSVSNNLSVDVTGVATVSITWKVNVKIISN